MLEAGRLTAVEDQSGKRIVYIIDDDAGVRMSLVFLLELSGMQPWPFANGFDLLDALPTLEAGCLLLDIRMPQIDGIQVMKTLERRGCCWPVIVMTGHGDISIAVQAMKLGAIEFIQKPFQEEILNSAIERGFAKLDREEHVRAGRQAAGERLDTLSGRETAVLRGLLTGQQNKAVAHELSLSVRTVEMHRANMLNKLGVRTLQEASALVTCAKGAAGL